MKRGLLLVHECYFPHALLKLRIELPFFGMTNDVSSQRDLQRPRGSWYFRWLKSTNQPFSTLMSLAKLKVYIYCGPTNSRLAVRYLLEDAGVDYEWKGFTREEWPAIKASNPQLTFGQVPFYAEPGLALTQSAAIFRYLGAKHGYAGSNPQEAAKIDELDEGVRDLFDGVIKFLFLENQEEKAKGLVHVSDPNG